MRRIEFVPTFADFYHDAGTHGVYEHPFQNVYYVCDDCEENCFEFDNPADALMYAYNVDHCDDLPEDVRHLA
jgi:hypothetical protein